MNKTANISSQIHHQGQQPVQGSEIKADLGPAGDLLHVLVAHWMLVAVAIGIVLAVAYLFNWAGAAAVKGVTPGPKRPWGDPKIGFNLGPIFGGAVLGGLAFIGFVFGFSEAFSPVMDTFNQTVKGIIAG
jgi:hypothetical protein